MAFIDYLKDLRVITLIVIVVLLAALDLAYGVHFGIEFVGGTQIPITLEHSVDPSTMASLLNTLQQRVSTFGLKQVTVEGIGNTNVYVTVPSVSKAEIDSTINIIQSQGIFQALVSGREALNGSGIVQSTVGAPTPTLINGNATWVVTFYMTQPASVRFSKVVFGQANQPIYMFLDRPTGAILLFNSSLLSGTVNSSSQIQAMQQATAFGNLTIPIEFINSQGSNWANLYPFFKVNRANYTKVLLSSGTSNSVISNLTALNYSLVFFSSSNITPQFTTVATSISTQTLVQAWPAIGLVSEANLEPSLTNGTITQSLEITGAAPTTLGPTQKLAYATNQTKTISSILTGGALPVHVIVGTPTTIPPTLGKHFELISGEAAVLAIIAVSMVITIRYRKAFLIVPIILTTLTELFIIVSIIGLIGTIDLAAVAGMIAVIGTGVDAQIIITDEILSGSESTMKIRLGNAFYIIWSDAALLVIAMLPLLFSVSLVDIIGFSESTILGALLGVLITRPAYGAIVSRRYSK